MRSHTISKKEAKAIMLQISESWPFQSDYADIKESRIVEIEGKGELYVSEIFRAIKIDKIIIPFLQSEIVSMFPHVVVDSGAIKFVVNGADIMRPGITSFPQKFLAGDIVIIREEKYGKSIAVGLAKIDDKTASNLSRGPVIQTLHYTGDKFWEIFKNI